jgi:hypothetical protein
MKNRLTDLNDHLFTQLERLSEEGLSGDKLADEITRAAAMVQVADKIVDNARLQLDAVKLVAGNTAVFSKLPPMLGLTAGEAKA